MGIRATQSEAAKEFGVSRQAIHSLIKRGKLARDEQGRVDLDDARLLLGTMSPGRSKAAANLAAGAPTPLQASPDQRPVGASSQPPNGASSAPAAADPPITNFHTARTLAETYRALNERAEYEERTGKLVKAEDVHKEAFTRARAARDALMALPARLAAMLASESSVAKCHEIMAAEIRRVCEDLAEGQDLG